MELRQVIRTLYSEQNGFWVLQKSLAERQDTLLRQEQHFWGQENSLRALFALYAEQSRQLLEARSQLKDLSSQLQKLVEKIV